MKRYMQGSNGLMYSFHSSRYLQSSDRNFFKAKLCSSSASKYLSLSIFGHCLVFTLLSNQPHITHRRGPLLCNKHTSGLLSALSDYPSCTHSFYQASYCPVVLLSLTSADVTSETTTPRKRFSCLFYQLLRHNPCRTHKICYASYCPALARIRKQIIEEEEQNCRVVTSSPEMHQAPKCSLHHQNPCTPNEVLYHKNQSRS